MTVIPSAWRYKIADNYLAELIIGIIGVGSGIFGAAIVMMPREFAQNPSFSKAFEWAPPYVWGLTMVVLAVAMLTLLMHSRAFASIPTFLLAIVWVSWVLPIAMSPGFSPSAPIAYGIISALTLVAGLACTVPRRETVSPSTRRTVILGDDSAEAVARYGYN